MDEDFLDVTESGKKTWLIFILVIVVLGTLGYFFIFRKFNFSIKTVKVELGSTISTDVQDYLSNKVNNPANYKLDLKNANPNEVGEYTYTITYNRITKKGKIKVEDTTPPKFELQDFTIEEGTEDYYLGDFLVTCSDLSMPCLVSFKNDKDNEKFKEVGTHELDIYVADLYGNKESAKAKLIVVPKGTYVDPKSTDLEIASNSRGEDYKGLTYIILEKGHSQDSDEASDILNEMTAIDFEKYVENNYPGFNLVSSDVIELYNKSSYIIGYSIELQISNSAETKTVYVDKEKMPNDDIEN